jgi:hypothetical protein
MLLWTSSSTVVMFSGSATMSFLELHLVSLSSVMSSYPLQAPPDLGA